VLKSTPFHPRTAPLCQTGNWRRWAGFTVASSYEPSFEREYWAIRNSAALIDVSPLYKYRIRGRDAERLLNRVLTRDVTRLGVGRVAYSPWCDGRGKVIDDGTLHRLGEAEFRLTAADPSLRWLTLNANGMTVEIEDESDRIASLALQGPLSRAILSEVVDADLESLRYYALTHGSVRDVPLTISRTGYTGDLGYELWMDAGDALPVWDSLIEAGEGYGITPAGMLALDLARVEAGLLLIEVDYLSAYHALLPAQTSTPDELGLGWAVGVEKPTFNGKAAIRAERRRGHGWGFVGIEVDYQALVEAYARHNLPPGLVGPAWRGSVPIFKGNEQIGYGTSGGWSPLLKRQIALAHLRDPHTSPGTEIEIQRVVEHQPVRLPAAVTKTPFFNPARKREVPAPV
jgi:aminomethyltransferase